MIQNTIGIESFLSNTQSGISTFDLLVPVTYLVHICG